MKVQVIVAAGGAGQRLKNRLPKALVHLKKKPLVVYSLNVFQKSSLIDSVIVAAHKNYLAQFKRVVSRYRLSKVKKIIPGGATRRESVANGLKALDSDTDAVLIHDAARPFIGKELIKKTISSLKKERAVIVAVPVTSTVKSADHSGCYVEETLPRETLWEVQTPQAFKKDVILEAHRRVIEKDPCDDALLVERLGIRVKIIPGNYKNIKVTTKEDLMLAESFLK